MKENLSHESIFNLSQRQENMRKRLLPLEANGILTSQVYISVMLFLLSKFKIYMQIMKRLIGTRKYVEDKDTLFSRHEHIEEAQLKPWSYTDQDAIIMGKDTCRFPFIIKSPVAMSGMSYGALGDHAITALSYGLKDAGSYMNTGEGGLSPHHLKGGADIIIQKIPALPNSVLEILMVVFQMKSFVKKQTFLK